MMGRRGSLICLALLHSALLYASRVAQDGIAPLRTALSGIGGMLAESMAGSSVRHVDLGTSCQIRCGCRRVRGADARICYIKVLRMANLKMLMP